MFNKVLNLNALILNSNCYQGGTKQSRFKFPKSSLNWADEIEYSIMNHKLLKESICT